MHIQKLIFFILVSLIFLIPQITLGKEPENQDSTIIHGYISNKTFIPLKLKIYEIDKNSLFSTERNLEDNSFIPLINLMVTAETTADYTLDKENIFIPRSTKLRGYISEIEPPGNFNRKGFYKVKFDNVLCPDGENIYLKSNIISKSTNSIYSPFRHLGKTTLSLVGGVLAGSLFSYKLGGLGLTVATHGYSLAAGAAVGGFIGTVGGITSKGKDATIEPGSELTVAPVDEISLEELKQITCKKIEEGKENQNKDTDLKILSVKQKKDILGEGSLKIEILFTNNSDEHYRLNNFFLRDSQGKEYTTSFINLDTDMFIDFPPKEAKNAILEFYVDYPKASHWLVLKNKDYSKDLAMWEITK